MQPSEIEALAQTGTGLAHCPSSNCRLGSGIAPLPDMAAAGVNISIGVDGSGSNEAGNMLAEVRLAWLLHRATHGAAATTVEQAIHWGSAGGAQVLGLDAVGTLEVGKAADLAIYDTDGIRGLGFHDPALSPIVGGDPVAIRHVMVGGRSVVENGAIPGLDVEALRAEAATVLDALR
jgi:8-oxoguanine deaminase